MEVSLDDFRRHFELLSDDALLSTNREDLVESARECYDEEVARRGLNSPSGDDTAEDGTSVAELPEGDRLVVIATYHVAEEASLARGLLQIAGIPSTLDNEYSALGGFELRLMVPSSYEEHAREVLETEISDEELAAQAEAAAIMEENPEAEHPEESDSEVDLRE